MSWGPYRKTEGGSGGKLGHSRMTHRDYTSEIKDSARVQRRIQDREEATAQLNDLRDPRWWYDCDDIWDTDDPEEDYNYTDWRYRYD